MLGRAMGTCDATTKYRIESHAADWLRLAGLPAAGPIRIVDADLSTITSASASGTGAERNVPPPGQVHAAGRP